MHENLLHPQKAVRTKLPPQLKERVRASISVFSGWSLCHGSWRRHNLTCGVISRKVEKVFDPVPQPVSRNHLQALHWIRIALITVLFVTLITDRTETLAWRLSADLSKQVGLVAWCWPAAVTAVTMGLSLLLIDR